MDSLDNVIRIPISKPQNQIKMEVEEPLEQTTSKSGNSTKRRHGARKQAICPRCKMVSDRRHEYLCKAYFQYAILKHNKVYCAICQTKRFNAFHNLFMHLSRVHFPNPKTVCEHCEESFPSYNGLQFQMHLEKCKIIKNNFYRAKNGEWFCIQCEAEDLETYTGKKYHLLLNHLARVHGRKDVPKCERGKSEVFQNQENIDPDGQTEEMDSFLKNLAKFKGNHDQMELAALDLGDLDVQDSEKIKLDRIEHESDLKIEDFDHNKFIEKSSKNITKY